MTKEFYEQRKTDLLNSMIEWAKVGKCIEARTTCGRLWELIDIAYCVEGIISTEQYHADNAKVSDDFYNNL